MTRIPEKPTLDGLEDRWAAQSFIPTEDVITRVQLYIVALNRTDSMLSLLPQVLTDRPLLHTVLSLFAQNHVSNIGDVVVSIRSTLENKSLQDMVGKLEEKRRIIAERNLTSEGA